MPRELCTVSMATRSWSLRPRNSWELAIYPEALALLRFRVGEMYGAAFRHSSEEFFESRRRNREGRDLTQLVELNAENRIIPVSSISHARLRRGILYSRLALELADGESLKVIWPRRDPNRINPALREVEKALRGALGSQLEVS